MVRREEAGIGKGVPIARIPIAKKPPSDRLADEHAACGQIAVIADKVARGEKPK